LQLDHTCYWPAASNLKRADSSHQAITQQPEAIPDVAGFVISAVVLILHFSGRLVGTPVERQQQTT
jgi:hypothetical protein